MQTDVLVRQEEAEGDAQKRSNGVVSAGFCRTQIPLRLDVKMDTQTVRDKA